MTGDPSENGSDAGQPRTSVAFDATALLGRRTGVGVFCAGALGGLAENRSVTVTAFAVSWRRRRGIVPLVPSGVRVDQRPMPARPLHAAWRRLPVPPIEWFVGRCDVVHGTNFVVPPAHRAARVVTVHDLTTLRFPELCDQATLRFPALVRAAVRRGAWVHTPSKFVAEEVVEAFGVDRERVRAVPHGIPDLAAAVNPSALSSPTGSATAPPAEGLGESGALSSQVDRYILAVGTVEPRKDLPGLVRAFDLLAGEHPDLTLVLAGPDGWGTAALDAALAASPYRHRVVRTGWVGDSTLAALLAGAAVLAYPSVYEGFGFPPLQAMAVGVPVVATRAGAVPEVVGDGAVLVPPGDPTSLADALVQVVTDERETAALVDRGVVRARQFTWEACADGLAHLYRDVRAGYG